MTLPLDVLRADTVRPALPPLPRLDALVVGGGGALGSLVLEMLLARRRAGRVRVLVTQPLRAAFDGLDALIVPSFDGPPPETTLAETALVVFDRVRHANGRENAFLRPAPESLPALARWLRGVGVRHLMVVLPIDPAGAPLALRAGLANLDEHQVASLGFEHVIFVRPAHAPARPSAERWLQRLADAVLAQLRLMLPASQQPVRSRQVAAWVVELAVQLPGSPPGTRVASPELVWQAAQGGDGRALAEAWLAGRELPPLHAPRVRM